MTILDTNVLVHAANVASPLYQFSNDAIDRLQIQGETLAIFPQVCYEFWTAATRPTTAKGLGLSIAQAVIESKRHRAVFTFLRDQPDLFDEWDTLVVTYQCHGKVAHDARIVAAMNTHGVERILTFNAPDFQRFPWITILDPRTVANGP
jgi:predicted nucleic acid-binding protein